MQTPLPRRTLLRVAQRLHKSATHPKPKPEIALPEAAWLELRARTHRLAYAERRCWRTAATQQLLRFERSMARMRQSLQETLEFERPRIPTHVPGLRDIYTDLVALQDEFEELRCDLREKQLSVVTRSIVLDDVDLGRFEIVLNLSRLGERCPFDVLALDPCPSSEDSSTTHPHVRDGSLCAGDGEPPILNALQTGRIWDFFVLIRQVLETYNPKSAYRELAAWNGTACSRCGDMTADEDSSVCERCYDSVCGDCCHSCSGCHRLCCDSCLEPCHGCQDDLCSSCARACPHCDEVYCPRCLPEEHCPDCKSQNSEFHDAPDTTAEEIEATAATDPAIQPLHLGEAAVPA